MINLQQKEASLREELRQHKKVIVAYSGGVDSTLVAKLATEELGKNALITISKSPSLPEYEFQLATQLAKQHDFNLEVIETQEMNDTNYTSNPHNRCYFCKKELYSFLKELSKEGVAVMDGTNHDDTKDIRHGRKAANELGIVSPLVTHQVTKAEVREMAKKLGLENWDKPQAACLSSRFPQGTEITHERLKKVEDAEMYLKTKGIEHVRVRYHDKIARIEIDLAQMPSLLSHNQAIHTYFQSLGFQFVTIDILGYRQGSLNVAVK